jgi:transposase
VDVEVTGGVDTHADTHTAAAVDSAGRMLGHRQFPATSAGYRALWGWLCSLGALGRVGVEGTGAYGAGLARFLTEVGVIVLEVDRPDRKIRREHGKSDPVDAEAAARAVLCGRAGGVPKQRDGQVEALRQLRVARGSAVDMRARVLRQMKTLIVNAPDVVRAELRGLRTAHKLIAACVAKRPDLNRVGDPTVAVVITLRSLARRHRDLSAEIEELNALLEPLVQAINPTLCAVMGVGTDVAGQLLVTAGDNPERIHSEGAFAKICGVAPLPASSGRTHRHRLNRGGDRQANCALYRITLIRLRWHEQTRAYMQRRTTEGLTKKEIIRCLKRYIAREIYTALLNPNPTPTTP